MKVLVTGANGFLGSWVVKALLEKNHRVSVIHREKSDMSALQGFTYQSLLGDVTNKNSLIEATKGIDAVINVAAVIAYDRSQRSTMEKVNVQGTQNVIEACLKNGVKRLVHTSSIVTVADAPHIKGAKDGRGVSNEDSPYNMAKYNLGYFETKRTAEQNVMEAARKNSSSGFEAIVLNPGNVFGPGDGVKGSRKTHLKVAKGEFPFYTHGGMSICHVEDVALAHVTALTQGRSGERYIVAGENLTIKECFTELAHAAGNEPPSFCLPNWGVQSLAYVGEAMSLLGFKTSLNYERAITSKLYMWFDSSRARKELDYNPRPGKLALRESIHWCKEHKLV